MRTVKRLSISKGRRKSELKDDVIVELSEIRKEFPGVIALDKVNMKIREGHVHALVGENGAGKSTLMKILSGTYLNYGGEILIRNKKVKFKGQKDAFAAGISIVAQELNCVGERTIAENLYLGREPLKFGKIVDKKKRYEDTKKYLDFMGLDYDPNEKMDKLSVAQKQMVEIVKAISRNSKVIIMDEPTSALTNKEADVLFDKIKDLSEQGIAFVFITHRLEEVFEVCDEYTVLRDGVMIATGNICDVDQDKIITMMVGRDIADIYPALPEFDKNTDEVSVNDFSSEGVFSNISFTIHKGEIFGLAGMMGAGRSEIARSIFGMDKFDGGQLLLDGKEIKVKSANDAIKNGIAMVTEDRATYGFVGVRSIKDNIELPNGDIYTKHGWLQNDKITSSTTEIFNRLSIKAPNIETKVANLSGGNQQKVVLAKWLVRDVKFLILDEPTRGIDVGAKQEIYNLIVSLAKQGMAILLISSDMPEVLSMSHRVAVVAKGRITGVLSHDEATQSKVMQMIVEAK